MKATYSTAEAAQLLGDLSVRSVQRYISGGKLKADRQAVGLDWHYVISGEELRRFADDNGIPLQEPETASGQ